MSSGFDTQPPKAYLRICETSTAPAGRPAVCPQIGEVLRVLAASRPGGVFLSLGYGAGEAGTWLLDGMDLASRLVVVVEDLEEADALGGIFADDLRVTVHVQDATAFLADVRDHRFDLITDLNPTPSASLARLSLSRLALGGFFMTRQRAPALAEMVSAPLPSDDSSEEAPDPSAYALTHLPGKLGVTLIARRTPRLANKRRGGRRARSGVTPLFSPRTRGGGD